MMYVLVNAKGRVSTTQTTHALIEALRKHEPVVAIEPDDLGLHPDGHVLVGPTETLRPGDRVLIRTNPGRAKNAVSQQMALQLLAIAEGYGVQVMNRPQALLKASTKLYLSSLPERLRPRTLVSRSREVLRQFVQEASAPVVLKPISGTQGRDVFLLHKDSENLPQIIDVLCRVGLTMAQDYVPEAVEGDTRVLVLGGKVLELDGALCAVRRVPPSDDFRSNVAIGGKPREAALREEAIEVAAEAARLLLDDGIHFAGLDIIGSKIVEANVFSPGGIPDANAFTGKDFLQPVVDYLLGSS